MKFSLSVCCVLAALCLSYCSGFTVRQSKPIKFLVLQKSDILSDGKVAVKLEGNKTAPSPQAPAVVEIEEEEKIPTTTDAEVDESEEDADDPDKTTQSAGSVNDEPESVTSEPESSAPWNPVDAWNELNFPKFPTASVDPNEPSSPPQVVDVTGSKATISTRLNTFVGSQVCQCGRPRDRIVMGEPAKINDIPWTVALARNGFFGFGASKKPYCGGTLINDRYVATASHCVDAMFAPGIKVWMNDEDLVSTSETQGGRQVYDVERIIMHPQYDRRTVNYDIALLKLRTPVPISAAQNSDKTYITPACIPVNNDANFTGQIATVAGWGVTSQGGSLSNVLQKVNVPIIDNDVCNRDTQYTGKITENMMCAGYIEEGGRDSCQGDSGGPLIIDNNDRKTLVGVVSWGFGCAKPKAPGVYSRVGRFSAWILENTKDAEWCGE
jgi:hypothetical protein